eukprot:gnl/TRDRNA2_/TRDRNA2_191146_c0_seq1.p1 gnl/TRDRNA2_/TRDRNA2_191146_c0~~gnl/TRDRNA2_/TRDRNA2_191146_c0_seq1.p1  ORF type:complete len:255 (-),score=32.38 gnl/TRDRNA2_/TRDRNA2_191146_c0_seq1:64-828(-)
MAAVAAAECIVRPHTVNPDAYAGLDCDVLIPASARPPTAPAADGRSRRIAELREHANTPEHRAQGYQDLGDKIEQRIFDTRKEARDLQAALNQVRRIIQDDLMVLKHLELEKIDLQTAAQRLATARANWRQQHVGNGVTPSSEVERRLVEEEQTIANEIQTTSMNIGLVSAQVARERDLRDELDSRLKDKQNHIHIDNVILEHRNNPVWMPRGLRSTASPRPKAAPKVVKDLGVRGPTLIQAPDLRGLQPSSYR